MLSDFPPSFLPCIFMIFSGVFCKFFFPAISGTFETFRDSWNNTRQTSFLGTLFLFTTSAILLYILGIIHEWIARFLSQNANFVAIFPSSTFFHSVPKYCFSPKWHLKCRICRFAIQSGFCSLTPIRLLGWRWLTPSSRPFAVFSQRITAGSAPSALVGPSFSWAISSDVRFDHIVGFLYVSISDSTVNSQLSDTGVLL